MTTILKGDTVYTVSQRYNLPLREIISLNNLSPPYNLSMGYRLKLPPPNDYVVRPGDTLNRVSRMYGVSVSEMAKLNNMSSPYVVKTGQVLRLPTAQPKLERDFAENPPAPVFETSSAAAVGVPSVEREVLAPLPGQVETAAVTTPAPGAATAAAPAAKTGFPPQPAAKTADVSPEQTATVQKASAALPSNVAPKIPARSGSGRFMRPIDGKIISSFGPKEGGLHNDGINIKAARGTSVRAAENGVIAYTGNEMAGYGNLVLVRHADRYMTAYAHMDKTLVKKGDVVKAGQAIGTVGATGQVDSPQLHFEVRKGTQAVDPAKYL